MHRAGGADRGDAMVKGERKREGAKDRRSVRRKIGERACRVCCWVLGVGLGGQRTRTWRRGIQANAQRVFDFKLHLPPILSLLSCSSRVTRCNQPVWNLEFFSRHSRFASSGTGTESLRERVPAASSLLLSSSSPMHKSGEGQATSASVQGQCSGPKHRQRRQKHACLGCQSHLSRPLHGRSRETEAEQVTPSIWRVGQMHRPHRSVTQRTPHPGKTSTKTHGEGGMFTTKKKRERGTTLEMPHPIPVELRLLNPLSARTTPLERNQLCFQLALGEQHGVHQQPNPSVYMYTCIYSTHARVSSPGL